MILVLAYFKNSDKEVFVETIYDVEWDDDDEEGYYESEQMKIDVYSLKLIILQKYYGEEYKSEIVDNKKKYEEVFDEFFTYKSYLV